MMKYKKLIDEMTLEEKASLMSGKDFWQTQDISHHGISSIALADGPHGLRKQLKDMDYLGNNSSIPATCYPTAATIANSWDLDLIEKVSKCLGREAVSQGVNVLLGPGINIKRNPLCGRNFEYFSEDPYLSGKMAAAYIRGVQSNGVSACVKHFCANNQEFRRMTIDAIVDERTLREIYLTAFEIAIKEGKSKAIMSSYNKVNGIYTNENIHLLKDILRDEWNFEGCVISDWGGSNDRVSGMIAGNELEMPGTLGQSNKEIIDAVINGKIKEEVLDECVDRLLDLIFTTEERIKKEDDEIDIKKYNLIAEKAAEESIVLLKNEENILPLKENIKVAVIGDFAKNPRYQGRGSSIVNPTILENTLDCIKEYKINFIGYEQGFNRCGKRSRHKINKACELAKKAEVILLYIGLDDYDEAEGIDRKTLSLAKNQIDLINALYEVNKNIVAILCCGTVVEMKWINKVKGLIHSYLGGQAVANAVLKVLCGVINPSGKLTETYPLRYEDTPSYEYFPGKEATVEYREGIYVGYRYYDTANVEVLFPFGYGLSYTTFKYSNIKVYRNKVIFKITNTGQVAGSEIAQLYVGCKSKNIFRPKKELKGFTKVFLRVGETRTLTINFDDKTFRYFNVKTNKWEVESAEYKIMIGASSQDIRLSSTIFITGSKLENPYDKNRIPSYYKGKINHVKLDEFEVLLGKKAPSQNWDRSKEIQYNDTISQCQYARGILARCSYHIIVFSHKCFVFVGRRDIADTLLVGIYNMPFRGLTKVTAGAINKKMVDGILMMVNGHLINGASKFIRERNKII